MRNAPACAEADAIRRLLALREEDGLTREEERRLKAHLAACSGCAAPAIRLDPSLLFSPLSASREAAASVVRRGSLHPAALEEEAGRVVADVLAAVEVDRVRRRLRPDRHRLSLVAAAVALLGAGLLGYATTRSSGGAGPETRLARKEPRPAALQPSRSSRPLIEGLQSRGATVYQFSAAEPNEPSVVFVVDRNADL